MRSFFIFLLVAVLLFMSAAQPANAVALVDDAMILITLLVFGVLGITATYASGQAAKDGVGGLITDFLAEHPAFSIGMLFPPAMVASFLDTGELVFTAGHIWNEFVDWVRDTVGNQSGDFNSIVDGVNRLSQYSVVQKVDADSYSVMRAIEVDSVTRYDDMTDVEAIAGSNYEIYGFFADRQLQSGSYKYKDYFFISDKPFTLRLKLTTIAISGDSSDDVSYIDKSSTYYSLVPWIGYHILNQEYSMGRSYNDYSIDFELMTVDNYIIYDDYNGQAPSSPMFQQAVLAYLGEVGVLPPLDIPLDDIDISVPDEDNPDLVYAPPLPDYWKDVIDGVVDGISDKVLEDIIEGVGTGAIPVPGIDELVKDPAIPGVDDPAIPGVDDPAIPGDATLTWDNTKPDDLKIPKLTNFFPFCVPFDLIALVEALNAKAVAPVFRIPVDMSFAGYEGEIVIDLRDFDAITVVVRWGVTIFFILGLTIVTRKMIKG